MDWVEILIYAVSGGLASLIPRLFIKNVRERLTLYTVVTVVLLFALVAIGKATIKPIFSTWDIESEFANVPYLETIKQYEPETYEQLIARMGQARDDNRSQQEITDLMAKEVTRLMTHHMPHASNKATLDWVTLTLDQMEFLQNLEGDLCFKFLHPGIEGGIKATEVFPEELTNRSMAVISQIIETSSTDPQDPPDESEILPYLESIMTELVEEYGEDVLLLETPGAVDADRQAICEMTHALYSKIVELPEEQAAGLLRWMMSGV